MSMSNGKTDQAGVEVDKLVTVNVLDNTALARLCYKRIEPDE